MTKLLDRLTQDHKHLLLLLDLFDKMLENFHAGSDPDFELLGEMLEYLETYADVVHHPSEELIFQRVVERGNRDYRVLQVLSKQHLVLSDLTRYFRQAVQGIVREEVVRRDTFEAQGRDLIETLRKHLELEEAEAFPLARQVLSEEDWGALDNQVSHAIDPVFGERDSDRFHALYDYLLKQARS
jgi:hemerythrin-like domain-containing protein